MIAAVLLIVTTVLAAGRAFSEGTTNPESRKPAAASLRISDVKCEYLDRPLAVDMARPRLSWQMESGEREQRQTAWHLLVASSRERLDANVGDLWDSGKVESDQSIHVEYSGKPLAPGTECHWKVRVWDKHKAASDWSKPSSWSMGVAIAPPPRGGSCEAGWQARWIRGPDADADAAVWLRKGFDLPDAPARAIARVNIAGYAELYVNGRKVGNDILTPAVSDHNLQTFYVSYDVAPLLKKGRNVMALWLGRGWANGVPCVRAQINAQAAGRPFVLGTDATWKGKASSYRRIGGRQWNDFGGERFDARAHLAGWSGGDFDDGAWKNAVEGAGPPGAAVAHPAPLNRIGKVIPAAAVTALPGGRHELDFGTALTGWLRLKMPSLGPGASVKMTFADVRRPKGGYQHFNQVSEFISAGKAGESFENKFNYAGFRYVVVEGLPSAPAKEDAVAMLVESDLDEAGSFACSNDLLNRIHRLTQWTQRSLDLGGYYVDCPHRERMGYGDGQVAAEGFMTSFRADRFYRKWLSDWRLRQAPDGNLPHMAPFGQGGGGPAWPGLLAAITWRHYLYYGDCRVLEENYDAVRRYADRLETICRNDVLRKFGGKWDFIGDWVPPGRGMDTKNWPGAEAAELFNNCYRVYQWELLAKMAAALGRQDELARCRARLASIRPAVHAAFYDAAKKQYVIDEQAYYVMPLATGVTPESERGAVLKNLERNILVKNRSHLDTGMLGTYFMMEYLREIGRNDLVYTMFNQTTHPGWGHMLAEGATTCWEQWNGHWSHIHSCFTSADNWLYQGPAGIRPDENGPGFKKTILAPAVVGDLAWVKAHHDSPYGRIVSDWRREGARLTMNVVVPVNTSATVSVPGRGVTEGGRPAAEAEGVALVREEQGRSIFTVQSGAYRFESRLDDCPSGKHE